MTQFNKWRIWTVFFVLFFAVIQVLPTIIYYSKPLNKSLSRSNSDNVASDLINRADDVDTETLKWVKQLCTDGTGSSLKVYLDPYDFKQIIVQAQSSEQAQQLRNLLSNAGASLPFGPSQVFAITEPKKTDNKVILRKKFLSKNFLKSSDFHTFVEKNFDEKSHYYRINKERTDIFTKEILFGNSLQCLLMRAIDGDEDAQLLLCEKTSPFFDWLDSQPRLNQNFWSWLFSNTDNPSEARLQLLADLNRLIQPQKENIVRSSNDTDENKESPLFKKSNEKITQRLKDSKPYLNKFFNSLSLVKASDLEGCKDLSKSIVHPFFGKFEWDVQAGQFCASLHPELKNGQDIVKGLDTSSNADPFVSNWLIAETNRLAVETGETPMLTPSGLVFHLDADTKYPNFLAFDLGLLAQEEINSTFHKLQLNWSPKNKDLQKANYPLLNLADFEKSDALQQDNCILITSPAVDRSVYRGLKANGIYVIAKNAHQIFRSASAQGSETFEQLKSDFEKLNQQLTERGFIPVRNREIIDVRLKDSAVFELPNFADDYFKATREKFKILPNQRHALLPLGSLGQRLKETNRIESELQDDLIKWRDDYRASKAGLSMQRGFIVPPPSKNPIWENLKLNVRKYFRGDSAKALKWGLDLTGGKSVRIALLDQRGNQITNFEDLEKGRDELYARVNALGVAEVAIRIEGSHLMIDFPGSQDQSTDELISASSMSFHIVNEKFNPDHSQRGQLVNDFLKSVWNEALVIGKKDPESLTLIAERQLQGIGEDGFDPRFDELKKLGLNFSNQNIASSQLNENTSMIAAFKSDDISQWYRQSHPLLIVFRNWALLGSDLDQIYHQFDVTRGHNLSFQVKSGLRADKSSARDELYNWTQQFAKDQIAGTTRENDRKGGWRLAVILRSQIVSAPQLASALRDSASLTGNFTQREIHQLAQDLKGGSLSYTPKILSESNIDAQLGRTDRAKGILAAFMGFTGVVFLMVFRYRVMGFIACCALCLNLLLIWAVLQNMDAALTLPGIAGIVLTMGMAVDANVLIFERMREELKTLNPLQALRKGYRLALPAILDSNITTGLTALLLIQFDLGPIKGFAIALISGLVSSMFTALFCTNALMEFWLRKKRDLSALDLPKYFIRHLICLPKLKRSMAISVFILSLGLWAGWQTRNSIIGLDFTGGTSVVLAIQPGHTKLARERLSNVLLESGLYPGQFSVRQLGNEEQLRIEMAVSIDQKALLNSQKLTPEFSLDKIKNMSDKKAELAALTALLKKADLPLTEKSAQNLSGNWSTTSSQFSSSMAIRALVGIGTALLLSLSYLAIRFKWTYALASGIGLIHTLFLTASFASCLHAAHFPIELNLYVCGAAMTIIGYCLNDMIIIFDRIREDRKNHPKMQLFSIIEQAIDQTLSRTVMTCGTTLMALLFLLIFGGKNLFAFSSVMTLGVAIGTISSLYIVAPAFYHFEQWSLQSPSK